MTKSLKYTVIKSRAQYDEYCRILEDLISKNDNDLEDEIELLTVLIENWDKNNSALSDIEDPVQILKVLMNEHNLKAKDLTEILDLSNTK